MLFLVRLLLPWRHGCGSSVTQCMTNFMDLNQFLLDREKMSKTAISVTWKEVEGIHTPYSPNPELATVPPLLRLRDTSSTPLYASNN